MSLVLLGTTSMMAQGIKFEKGSWAEVIEKAKAEDKYIFVDAYAEWCGPCKWMAKNVFTDSKVAEHFNTKYINYKFDMEKGEGPAFAKNYTVNAYPTLLFFNADGEIVHKVLGAQPVDQLLLQSEKALDPSQQLFTMQKKYENGEKDLLFIKKYITALIEANEDASKPAADYLNSQKKKDWTKQDNFEIISLTQTNINSDAFQYVLSNKAKFENSLGIETVNNYVGSVYENAIGDVARSRDTKAYNDLKSDISKNLGDKAPEMLAFLDLNFYFGTENEFNYLNNYMNKFCKDAQLLNSFAWRYFEEESEKKKLKAALNWVNKSVSINKNWYNLDTKANLEYKLGKKKAAIKSAEEAVKLAKENGEDSSETEAFLKKIQKK